MGRMISRRSPVPLSRRSDLPSDPTPLAGDREADGQGGVCFAGADQTLRGRQSDESGGVPKCGGFYRQVPGPQ
eukprot:4498022-Pyramimonas_sp.AAC.1